jgi:hypothetical protein
VTLERRLLKLFAQPRIPGVKREPRHTCLLPEVHDWLATRARAKNISVSRAAAEIISKARGVDAATGERLRPQPPRRAGRLTRGKLVKNGGRA